MKKHKTSFTSLSTKKMFRTIKSHPFQFIAMSIIIALGVAFFNGLYGSYLGFKRQIDNYLTNSNVADLYTTLYYDDVYKSSDNHEQDYKLIKNIVGDDGLVEGNYYGAERIRSFNSFMFLTDELPTINHGYNFEHGEFKEHNFFYIGRKYLENESQFGSLSNWIDENGNLKEQEISINITPLKNWINNSEYSDIFSKYTLKDKKDVLAENEILIKAQPTATIEHAENVLPYDTLPPTFLMSRSFLTDLFKKSFTENYDLEKMSEDSDEKAKKCYELISNPKNIVDHFFYNNRYLTKLNNQSKLSNIENAIDEAYKSGEGEGTLISNVNLNNSKVYSYLSSDLKQSLQLCFVLPPIFFLVALLVALTTFSQLILKERTEIGTLKALGASNHQIKKYYFIFATIIATVGILIGAITGPFILPPLLGMKNSLSYTLCPYKLQYPWLTVLLSSAFIYVILYLVINLVLRKESKELPALTMRHKEITTNANKTINSKSKSSTHKLCFKMAMRNIKYAKLRSIMVLLGVFGCTALLGCGYCVDDSINRGVDSDINTFFNADGQVSFSYFSDETKEGFEKIKDRIDYDAYACIPASCNLPVQFDKEASTNVYSINPRSNYHFFNLPVMPYANNIIVTSKIAKALNLHVNDYINFNILGKECSGQVMYILDTFYYHGIFVSQEYSDYPGLESYATNAYVRAKDPSESNEIIEEIRKIPGVANVLDQKNVMTFINLMVSTISYITLTIKIFAILLAIVVLYNLALLNFNENIRNIATMKVLGFNRYEIAESLLYEIMTLTLIGSIAGLLISFPFGMLVLSINQVPALEYIYFMYPTSFVFSFIISFGVAALVNLYLSLKNKNVKMVESLKSVE